MRLIYILVILAFFQSCSSQDFDSKAMELNERALTARMEMNDYAADSLLMEALKIDPSCDICISNLIQLKTEQGKIDEALEIVESMPNELKEDVFYYNFEKGRLLEFKNSLEDAVELYKVPFEQMESFTPQNGEELFDYVGYAILQTIVGHQEEALQNMNEALSLQWLEDYEREYVERERK